MRATWTARLYPPGNTITQLLIQPPVAPCLLGPNMLVTPFSKSLIYSYCGVWGYDWRLGCYTSGRAPRIYLILAGPHSRYVKCLSPVWIRTPYSYTRLTRLKANYFWLFCLIHGVSKGYCVVADSQCRTKWKLLRQSRRMNRPSSLKRAPRVLFNHRPYLCAVPQEDVPSIHSDSTEDATNVPLAHNAGSARLRNRW